MKRVLKLTGWCCAFVFAWASAPVSAADNFAERFALQLDNGASFYSVTLPAAVYAASQRSDLGDVRVVDSAGEAMPYSLEIPRDAARGAPTLRPVNWFPLPPAVPGASSAPFGVAMAADGSLRATAAPPAREQHDTDLIDAGRAARAGRVSALLVHLRDDNYQGRVTVEASDDLRHWQPAGDAQLLKVNANGSALSQDRVELDGAPARYLRLHWLDGTPYVESIDMEVQAVAVHAQRADAQRTWREGIVAHAGPKPGEYFFATGGPYPVDRLRLNLPQPDTVAPAVVYSRTGLDAPWREVSSATLFRLHNGAVEQNNPSLSFAPDTDRQWRVVVDTRNGGLGNGTLTVAAGWRPATLLFAARGVAPFALSVGSVATVSAAVSRDELLAGASSVVATARVGDALSLGPDADGQPAPPDARRRYLIGAALLLAVGSLAALAWRLARGARAHAQAGGASGAMANGLPVESGAMNAPAIDADAARSGVNASVNVNTKGDGKA
ncbi:DUF3999 domain-containing protein [Paraburkholderia sp. BCC1876]|uniref:DUF3999 domain-containing protein n=1 Tax=Paraburkholderia sp. BCC1876 TaxID=2676303 RepID=UPI001592AEAC|nr:DUF3999 domain-containing protein [Paraburkholderia sp. BCC1876]